MRTPRFRTREPNPPLHATPSQHEQQRGFAAAAACYLLWGVVPIYWKQLGAIDSVEVIAHRALWSLAVLLCILGATRGMAPVIHALRNPRTAGIAFVASLLLTANWLIYVYGVNTGRVTECSLGYFLVPLVNVATGRFVLHEPMRRSQWIAIALAAAGVAWMVVELGETPWLAIGLACTWGAYGLMRKRSKLGAASGLALETLLTAPLALAWIAWLEMQGAGAFLSGSLGTKAWLASTGVVTAIPLILFAYGASRIRLSTIGLLQYIAPSVQFVLGVTLYGEAFSPSRAVTFVLIWLGLAIYTIDNVRLLRRSRTS
jgi:chloramphenicol-sensitive protein RarD